MNATWLAIFVALFLIGCQPSEKKNETGSRDATVATVTNLMDGIELKKASDIEPRLKLVKDAGIEKFAQAIADVDEWLFIEEDEKSAREMIEREIDRLRQRIETEVANLTKTAIDAPNSKIASEKMSIINSLLGLYPAPKTSAQRTRLYQMTANVLATSKRVEDIRHLRYNAWAILRIQHGLKAYRDELAVNKVSDLMKLVKTNRETLISNCIITMSPIDPAYLDPATMDIYNYVLGLTRDAMGNDDDARIKLAKGFADPKVIRKPLSDF